MQNVKVKAKINACKHTFHFMEEYLGNNILHSKGNIITVDQLFSDATKIKLLDSGGREIIRFRKN
jgi:hypothetical protein